MKNSLFYCLIIFLALVSFKLNNENNFLEKTVTSTISPDLDNLPCFSSSKIYAETAILWQSSWVTYYDKIRGETYSDSPQLNFDQNKLFALYSEVMQKENPGVLLWYIMLDENDPYPSLAMQNTLSCKVDTESSILMSPWDKSGNMLITKDSLILYKQRWVNSSLTNLPAHTVVNGYNYLWNSLIDLMDNNPAPEGIFVNYGLRTLEPTEIGYITSPFTNKTGSAIYCNVLYDTQDESEPLVTLEDFAMPCPEYCG